MGFIGSLPTYTRRVDVRESSARRRSSPAGCRSSPRKRRSSPASRRASNPAVSRSLAASQTRKLRGARVQEEGGALSGLRPSSTFKSCLEDVFSATHLCQPPQVCNFSCVGICCLPSKRANLKEAKRDLIAASIPAKISSTQLGGASFSRVNTSDRRRGAVETWRKLKPSA